MDSMLRRNDDGLVCKLEIEKTYDHLNWEFVLEVMRRMSFGQRWLTWITWCMSTASFSILINGTPAGFFEPPLLVLGMDILSCLIYKVVEGNFLTGCKVGGRGGEELVLSHLLYANDTLLFC